MVTPNYILQAYVQQRKNENPLWLWRDVGVYDSIEEATIRIPTGRESHFRILYRGEEVNI